MNGRTSSFSSSPTPSRPNASVAPSASQLAERRRRVAYHEAGHVLVAWLTPGCTLVSAEIHPGSKEIDVFGRVNCVPREKDGVGQALALLPYCLGGCVGELVGLQTVMLGISRDDFAKAHQAAQTLVRAQAERGAPWLRPTRVEPGISRSFRPSPAPTEARVIDLAAREAHRLLAANGFILQPLADWLSFQDYVSGPQLQKFLAVFEPIRS